MKTLKTIAVVAFISMTTGSSAFAGNHTFFSGYSSVFHTAFSDD